MRFILSIASKARCLVVIVLMADYDNLRADWKKYPDVDTTGFEPAALSSDDDPNILDDFVSAYFGM